MCDFCQINGYRPNTRKCEVRALGHVPRDELNISFYSNMNAKVGSELRSHVTPLGVGITKQGYRCFTSVNGKLSLGYVGWLE